MSQRVLGILFGMNNISSVSRTIAAVLKSLSKNFVKSHLGFRHKTREDLLQNHSRRFFTTVLQADPEDLILVVDGTYLYIQQPTDMMAQKMTYSAHKHANLFKTMMVVCPDGYVLQSEGLYYADGNNNDSKIMQKMLRDENSILSVLQTRDKILMDRGFRDCEDDLKSMKVDYFMPRFLKKDQPQFTCEEANKTRQVTACRFIVETANARPKNKFKFFDHTILASYIPKLKEFWEVGISIINAFSPPLFNDSEMHLLIANKIVQKLEERNNTLQDMIQSWNDDNCEPSWSPVDEDCVLEFPTLTREDIHEICLGPYQPRIAKLYNKQHLSETCGYKFYMAKQRTGLIRVKMQSRHVKRQKYFVWVEFIEHGHGPESIIGHYCKCKAGCRTIGCCGHTAAVLSYLGFQRFEAHVSYRDLYSSILDAAEELSKEHGDEEDIMTDSNAAEIDPDLIESDDDDE